MPNNFSDCIIMTMKDFFECTVSDSSSAFMDGNPPVLLGVFLFFLESDGVSFLLTFMKQLFFSLLKNCLPCRIDHAKIHT